MRPSARACRRCCSTCRACGELLVNNHEKLDDERRALAPLKRLLSVVELAVLSASAGTVERRAWHGSA